jgi:eukaryotic-like serine/threonine-protein kinase
MTAKITCAGCNHGYDDSALFCPNCGRAKQREPVNDALIGKVLGERFLIQARLGDGGSGMIYRAEHVTLKRRVAIKVLHNELSRDDLAVERFRREATTVAEIDNEHIVEIHDFGRTPDGRLYLAMELLEGEALDQVIARDGQLSIERTADILIQVGEALMEAHAIGYVHRDIRPRNIYLAIRRGKANFVKLLDFGLSKLVETEGQAASTSLGMTFGDPRYMSPEQARGDRIDRRADIYQLGCVAYEMLTGAAPFSGNRVFDILAKQVSEAPAPLPTRRPGVPLWMEAAVAKMLAKEPVNRFATTTRMVEALRRGLETGEVMEEEVARRRESVPPPSVSRVMQKMGVSAPVDTPIEPAAAPANPPVPSHGRTMLGNPAGPAPTPGDSIVAGDPPVRRRTGTPQLGIPIVANPPPGSAPPPQPPVMQAPQVPPSYEPPQVQPPVVQPAVSGVIEPTPEPAPQPRVPRPDSANISQVWYEDGDRATADADNGAGRARSLSASSADSSYYGDEPQPRTRPWGAIIAVLALLIVGGTVAFALTRESEPDKSSTPSLAATAAATAPIVDAAPSTIIEPPADAAVAVAPPDAAPEVAIKPTEKRAKGDKKSERTNKPGGLVPSDPVFRRPGGTSTTPTTQPPREPPAPPAPPKPTGTGPSGVDGPVDPYGPTGGGTDTPPSDGAPSERKAEFYANLGTQQLIAGDTGGAASNFQKALAIDPKNTVAMIGQGEIALRQGLFGDAIAHLKKASRLAKTARVFTLLGEAYLNSGNHSEAEANFKKALQLDPDNVRARDGYNEATSRTSGD